MAAQRSMSNVLMRRLPSGEAHAKERNLRDKIAELASAATESRDELDLT